MTTSIPIKRPPSSAFQFHLGDEVDEKEIDKIDDPVCVDCNTLEMKPSMLSSLFTKDIYHKQKLQSKLDSASSKVETVSKLVDTAMFRVRDRVTHWMDSRLDHDAELKRATKLKEKIRRLEKLKVEAIELRTDKQSAFLARRQKTRRYGKGTLSQFLNSIDNIKAQRDNIEKSLNEVVIGESDKIQPNNTRQQSDRNEIQQQSEREMIVEEIQLAAQAKAVEGISMAKEVTRHKMVTPAKDREEAKLAIGIEE